MLRNIILIWEIWVPSDTRSYVYQSRVLGVAIKRYWECPNSLYIWECESAPGVSNPKYGTEGNMRCHHQEIQMKKWTLRLKCATDTKYAWLPTTMYQKIKRGVHTKWMSSRKDRKRATATYMRRMETRQQRHQYYFSTMNYKNGLISNDVISASITRWILLANLNWKNLNLPKKTIFQPPQINLNSQREGISICKANA